MKGAKPEPTALKIVRGNPGKRALPAHEPKPPLGADMPDWMSDGAKEHWPLVKGQLVDAGILTVVDASALALYCEAFAKWKYANDQVSKFGPVVKSPTGFPMQSPYLAISNRAWDQMVKLLIEFGMTPSSRSRVHAVAPTESDESKKQGLASFRR